MEQQVARATKHLQDILRDAIKLEDAQNALIIFDTEAPLARIMTEAYRQALPRGTFVDFAGVTPGDVRDRFDHLKPGDIVILIQSTNFRLNEFRLRIELFSRELKTIEHIHLARMDESQFDTYIESLSYDTSYYQKLGRALQTHLDQSTHVEVECKGTKLVYDTGMEISKLNIGDYTGMKNVGGTFPIGEVFTEAKDLRLVNGQAMVYAFAGEDHMVRIYEPFPVEIKDGILSSPNGPADFQKILALIQQDEEVLVREFGLGINPALDKHHLLNDITAFERQTGLHLSLGAKHGIYPKPGLKRKEGRYHVDIFVDVETITIDNNIIYQDGHFQN